MFIVPKNFLISNFSGFKITKLFKNLSRKTCNQIRPQITSPNFTTKSQGIMTTKRITINAGIVMATIFFIFVTTPTIWAAIYYIDATEGNDFNNGTSEATPWKTIAQVNSNSFSPGDSILFKRGETWRETLVCPSSGSTDSVITFGAYGTGAAPIISGSDLITAGWSKDSANIWKVTVTPQPNILYFNGARGTLVSAKTNITAEFNWYWASNVLYVWSPDDENPGVHYTAPGIEGGNRVRVLDTNNNSYVTIDGLTLRDGNTYDNIKAGSTHVTGIVIKNCTIERSRGSGVDLRGSTVAHDVIVDSCTIQNNGGRGICISEQYTAPSQISNNIVVRNGWASVQDDMEYSGIEGILGNFYVFGNTISETAIGGCKLTGTLGNYCHGLYYPAGFGGDRTIPVNIYKNVSYNNQYGAGFKSVGSANIYQNISYDNVGEGIQLGQNGVVNIVLNVYYNLIYNNNTGNSSNGIVEQNKGSGTIDLSINNNTFYNNANTTGMELKIADNVEILTIKNNLLFTSPTRRTMSIVTQTGTVSVDNNLHWRADGDPNLYYGGASRTWAQWQALGFDANGVNRDPLLVSPSTFDFTLKSASPCINAGTDVGLSIDLVGRQVPYGVSPNIGAYESPSPSPLPSAPLSLRIVPN